LGAEFLDSAASASAASTPKNRGRIDRNMAEAARRKLIEGGADPLRASALAAGVPALARARNKAAADARNALAPKRPDKLVERDARRARRKLRPDPPRRPAVAATSPSPAATDDGPELPPEALVEAAKIGPLEKMVENQAETADAMGGITLKLQDLEQKAILAGGLLKRLSSQNPSALPTWLP
jgi:hypothetical protein